MDFERHQNDLRVQRKANRTLGAIVALLSLCQLLSLGVIAGMVGSATAGLLTLPLVVLVHEISEMLVIGNGLRVLRFAS